jgi:hypothetical protein
MTLERYLSVSIKNWRTIHFSPKRALISCIVIVFFIFSLNIHLVATINYEKPPNNTLDGGCYSDKMHDIWQFVHLYMYNIIPFVLLSITNGLLIYRTCKTGTKTSTEQNKSKKKMMTLFIIIMTLFFIILTLPSSIAGGYFLKVLLSTDAGYTVLFFCDCLAFSYHAFNIIVLYFANKQFKRELKVMILSGLGRKNVIFPTDFTTKTGAK